MNEKGLKRSTSRVVRTDTQKSQRVTERCAVQWERVELLGAPTELAPSQRLEKTQLSLRSFT